MGIKRLARPGMAMTQPGHPRPPFLLLRHLGLLLVGLLVASSLLVLVIWAIPWWLTRQPVLAGAERYQAMANVRTGLFAAIGALGAGGSLAYTARTFRLSQVGQLTGRFESASKQMDGDDEIVRLAGIHAMAQLADEWVTQRQACIDVLCAFLRVTGDPARVQPDGLRESRRTALRVIKEHLRQGCGQTSWQQCEFDLTGAVLKEADFTGFTFAGGRFLFEEVQFEEDVLFKRATFAGAYVSFRGAKLKAGSRVSFANSRFRGGEVVFDDVTFGGGEARFDHAVFEPRCLVTFNRAQLGAGGSVYFKDTTVQGPGLCFTNARFSSENSEIRFDGATFCGTVHFNKAEFDGDVHFDNAKLVGAKLVFTGAKWNAGTISFEGADCTGMTMDVKKPDEGQCSIDLRRAKSIPRIDRTDPNSPRVLLQL